MPSDLIPSESPWQSFLPYHTAKDLLAHPGQNPVGREQRFDALVLFADVSGFTPMSEALGAAGRQGTEELTQILNSYFAPMIALIQAHGGIIGKFGGDAMTVLFPFKKLLKERIVRRGVQCALEMQRRMDRYAHIQTSAGEFALGMKAGLAAGMVYCTSVGDPARRLEYVIAGAALDWCAEAEHHAERGEVVLHPSVLMLAKSGLEGFRRDGFYWVSGLSRPERTAPLPALLSFPSQDEATAAAYIHPSIAARLRTGQAGFINEHRKVTIIFARFPGLDYMEDLSAGKRLQEYFVRVLEIVQRYDGYLNKIDMGDKGSKYIIVFGAPISHEDDPVRALRCAQELQELHTQDAKAMQSGRESTGTGFVLNIGINSGFVYCGQVGSNLRREYTVMGHAVNLAARLMQAAEPGQVLASAAVQRAAEAGRFAWGSPVDLKVKGSSEAIRVYALLHGQRGRSAQQMEPAYSLPMVGRQTELAAAQRVIAQAASGSGQGLGLTAEAGMGKSRLAAEVIQLAQAQGFGIFGGECLSHQVNTSYLVWRGVLRSLLEIDSTLAAAEQTAVLNDRIAGLNPAWAARLPLIGQVMNLPIPENELTASLDKRLRKESLEGLVVDIVRHKAAAGPLLLVFEDCHWIDPLSDDLLEAVAEGCRDAAVLLLVVYRPPDPPPAGRGAAKVTLRPNFFEIRLTEFTAQEAELLISLKLAQLFSGKSGAAGRAFPAELAARLAARAQGNPFYIDEMVNFIHDRGIDPQDSAALEKLELPDSLHSLIMSRVDQLSESARITLKVASVIGRSFRASWLWGIYPPVGLPEQVRAQLEELSRLEITPLDKPEPELEYLFKHIITREVAYASISVATRQSLHGQAGAFLEAQYADRLNRFVDLLAYHYGLSTNSDKQREYFRKAGEAAQAGYANAAALEYYQRLLPLLKAEGRAEIQRRIGEVYELTGVWDEADAHYCSGLEICDAVLAGEGPAAADRQAALKEHALLCFDLGNLRRSKGDNEDAMLWLAKARQGFECAGDQNGLCSVVRAVGIVYWGQGKYEEAIEAYHQTLDLAEQAGDLRSVYRTMNNIGQVYYAQGRLEEALFYYKRSMDLAVQSGDRFAENISLGNVGGVYLEQGRHREAMSAFVKSYEYGSQVGYRFLMNVALGNMGSVYLDYGQWEEALACYRLNMQIAMQMGDRLGVALALKGMALANAPERALMLERAVEITRPLDAPVELSEILYAQARYFEEQGDLSAAEAANDEAHSLAVDVEWDYIQFRTELLAARLALRQFRNSPEETEAELNRMLEVWVKPDQQAALFYELYQLALESGGGSDLQARQDDLCGKATNAFRGLYKQSPMVEYRQRVELLCAGEDLPKPVRLPDLPATVANQRVDIAKLLEQAG